ncbi:hypothetical protein OKW30_003493 [Paraburkholderia sp. Clong3]|uniref:hypothetical protein n=1 Tax=Paraburkholderia sp. Clong3 TaxID=2991061 RepID=UPI003D253811
MFLFQWKADVGLGDISTFLGFLAAAVGLFFTAWQLKEGVNVRKAEVNVRRAEFLLNTTERFFSDVEVRRLYYDIDYGDFDLTFVQSGPRLIPENVRRGGGDAKPFIGSEDERLLDSLLYTLDVIARIAAMDVMTSADVQIFLFQAAQVLRNNAVKRYIESVNIDRAILDAPEAHGAIRKLVEEMIAKQRRYVPH